MYWVLVAALDVVEAQREGGRDVEPDATRPLPGFTGPGDLGIDQTWAFFEHVVRRDIETLPPSRTAVCDQYVGLGKEFTELCAARLVSQLEHGRAHSDMGGVVPQRVLDIGWPPHIE